MSEFDFSEWMIGRTPALIKSAILLFLCFPLLRVLSGALRKLISKHTTPQSGMMVYKVVFYGGTMIIAIMIMRELGFKLTALLGAAGVAGVAIGFASQTSLSNFISGIFLIAEKSFQVGDVLQIGTTVGTVHSVDLLSLKLRTFDNKLVRIPNEHLVKNEFTNITRFPIRRYDILIGVAYKEDISRVIKVLKEVANQNPYCLDEPEPMVVFKEFADSSMNFQCGVWFANQDFQAVRNTFNHEIKLRFDQEGIEIPFPQRTLNPSATSEPFPVHLVERPADGDGS